MPHPRNSYIGKALGSLQLAFCVIKYKMHGLSAGWTMYWCFVVAFTLLITRVPATSFKTVNITDGELLKEYLCSSGKTIAPYTHLIIKHGQMELNNTDVVCLVENTTNIYISASWQDGSGDHHSKPAIVYCEPGGGGFSFFNVTNLAIESVQFRACGWAMIPAVATKYINSSDQFLYFNDVVWTTFLFNHCNNLTLYNALGNYLEFDDIDVIGVNLCGWSNITAVVPDGDLPTTPLSAMLIYYTDSAIMPSNSECNLHIESNLLSGNKHMDIEHDLGRSIERMSLLPSRDFALYVTQKDFEVKVDITLHPMLYHNSSFNYFDCQGGCGVNAIVLFVNNVTGSHVTFQGYPYGFCTDKSSIPYHSSSQFYRSIQLDVVFYETPSFSGPAGGKIITPLLILNTSFAFYMGSSSSTVDHHGSDILRVLQFSRKLSYQVLIENVAWCNNSVFFIPFSMPKWFHLLLAQSYSQDIAPQLYLKMTNLYARHNIYGGADPLRQLSSDSLVQFVNTVSVLSGTSYFGQNCGGSAINVVASTLTITGNLTVCDGYAYNGGGIELDSYSYLFLAEPLVARFINNSAQQGSAIYAPAHMNTEEGVAGRTTSAIQILPNKSYSQSNFSSINVTLYCSNTGLESSLYAPDFNFLGRQTSPHFLFDSDTWNTSGSCYTYTALIDTVFHAGEVDKYTSLFNGVCFRISGHSLKCSYVDLNVSDGVDNATNMSCAEVYPGATALSLVCASNKEYQFTYYYQQGIIPESAIRQVSCETKDYGLWKTSVLKNNLTVSFPFPDSRNYILPRFCLFVKNLGISKSNTISYRARAESMSNWI